MAEDRMAVLETVRKAIADGDVDFLREGVRVLAQAVMEAEVTELTGVPKGERDPERRLTNRNGYRERRWDTRVGTHRPGHPAGPRRRRTSRACSSRAGAPSGPSSRSSRRPTSWASRRAASRTSSTPSASPRSARARSAGSAPRSTPRSRPSGAARSADEALPVPVARRHVRQGPRGWPGRVDGGARGDRGRARAASAGSSGLELAAGNDEGSAWPAFIRSLVERGLSGVRLVISDDHRGLVKAVREQLLGAAWQRCRVHFTRNAQDLVPAPARSMVASAIRSIFEQPDERSAREQSGRVDRRPRGRASRRSPSCSTEAEADLLAHFTFPESHRRQIRSHQPARAAQQGDQAPDRGRRASSPTGPVSSASWAWSSPSRTTSGRTAGATSGPRRWPSSTPSSTTRR